MIFCFQQARAELSVGIYAGISNWSADYKGKLRDFKEPINTETDLESDLGLGRDNALFYNIAYEHDIAFLPNIMIASTTLEQKAENRLNKKITIQGYSFDIREEIETNVYFSSTDATLYYSLLQDWRKVLSVEAGVTYKVFDGHVDIGSEMMQARQTVEAKKYLLYAKSKFNLPLDGSYLSLSSSAMKKNNRNMADTSIQLGYQLPLDLSLEFGYRIMEINVDRENKIDTDLVFSGRYLAIYGRF